MIFSNLNYNCFKVWQTSRNKLKKHSLTKNCSDLSLFEKVVLVISKFLQSLEQFFLTVGRNNFGNKIPFLWEKGESFLRQARGCKLGKILPQIHTKIITIKCQLLLSKNSAVIYFFWPEKSYTNFAISNQQYVASRNLTENLELFLLLIHFYAKTFLILYGRTPDPIQPQ